MNEDYYERMMQKRCGSLKGCAMSLVGIVVLVLLCLLCSLTSCTTTKYVPVETVRTEYVYKTDSFIQKDSIFLKDSVYIHQKGDTVWFEKWHTQYIDKVREVVRVDSFIKYDSIQVPYPIEKKLTKWQQTKVDWGGWAMLMVVIVSFITIWLVIKRLQRQG